MLKLLPLGCSEGKPVSSTHYHFTLEGEGEGGEGTLEKRRDYKNKTEKELLLSFKSEVKGQGLLQEERK